MEQSQAYQTGDTDIDGRIAESDGCHYYYRGLRWALGGILGQNVLEGQNDMDRQYRKLGKDEFIRKSGLVFL